MKDIQVETRRRTGRPLSFDREAALEKAMLLFWKNGYEGTSLVDLTKAMGVTPPSIYTAFGDKKSLFLESVALYVGDGSEISRIIDDSPSAREAVHKLLLRAAIRFTGGTTPKGCLLVTSAISASKDSRDIQDELAGMRRRMEARLKDRIAKSILAGQLPTETDADALAAHAMAVTQGMSILARDGTSREILERMADTAMNCWPREN